MMTRPSEELMRAARSVSPAHTSIHEGRTSAAGSGDLVSGDILDRLGPFPAQSLRAMVDYGLNDYEIGRYFGLPPWKITRLRKTFGIAEPE